MWPRLKRAFDDWNEAGNQEISGRNPYYWLEPNQFKTDTYKMPYRKYFSRGRRRLTGVRPRARPPPAKRLRGGRGYSARPYRNGGGKNWKAAARRQVGERVGTAVAKTKEILTQNTLVPTRELVKKPLIDITTGQAINQRLREMINLRGIRFDINMTNLSTDQLIVNWAVVHPSASNMGGNADGNTFPEADFFRGYAAGRSEQPGIQLNGLQWTNAAINTDLFAVLKRGQITLNPGRLEVTPEQPNKVVYRPQKGNTVRVKTFYLKMNRQIRFDAEINFNRPLEQIFFVMWADAPMSTTSQAKENNAFVYTSRHIMYYREVKN